MTSPAPRPRRRAAAARQADADAASDPMPVAGEAMVGAVIEPAPAGRGPMTVTQGAVGRAEATTLEVHQGAVGSVRADTVTVEQSAVGLAAAGEVHLRQAIARSILTGSARVEQSFVRTLVAGEVRIERATGVGVLIARKVVGDVKVLLDWRGALAFGAAVGVVAGLVGRGRKRAVDEPTRGADRAPKRAARE